MDKTQELSTSFPFPLCLSPLSPSFQVLLLRTSLSLHSLSGRLLPFFQHPLATSS